MRKVRYSVAMSLDGYIAGPKGEYDWIPMDPEIDFAAMFKDFDTVLMGRRSYDLAKQEGGAGMPLGMKAYVFSKKLKQKDCPDAIVSDDPRKIVTELIQQKSKKDIWFFGGGQLFRSLLEYGLVDTVEIGLVPVLLGGGLPMLPSPTKTAKLKLTSEKLYPKTGTLLLTYAVM